MTTSEDWWLTDYADEIHDYMRDKEKQRPFFRMQSPSLHTRRRLIDWLARVSDQHTICPPVFHLAVYLMDYFMDRHQIDSEHLKLIALGSLLVASKSEERDLLVPRTSELNKYVQCSYLLSDFVNVEVTLLEYFQWNLVVPTAAHFLEYYIIFSLSASDLHEGRPLPSLAHGKVYMSKYSEYFLDISLRDHRFIRFPPSLVASSCIAASRICLFLTPTWPQILYTVTYYDSDMLASCIELMLGFLEEDEREMNSRKKLCCSKC